jgi:hypothetical protein
MNKCLCGCGGDTEIIVHTRNNVGAVKGEYNKYILGHNSRGPNSSICNPASVNSKYHKYRNIVVNCGCGCGKLTNPGRKYVYGHNNAGRKYIMSEERKENIRQASIGKIMSESAKLKMKLSHANFIMPEKTKEKLRQYTGDKTSQWLGGKSFEPYTVDFSRKLKRFIKERDGCCMLCKVNFEDLKQLRRQVHIHHVDYNKLNSFMQNLLCLCTNCHMITNHDRDKWKIHFQSLLKEKYNYYYTQDQKIILDF